jgi:hypothetical protein
MARAVQEIIGEFSAVLCFRKALPASVIFCSLLYRRATSVSIFDQPSSQWKHWDLKFLNTEKQPSMAMSLNIKRSPGLAGRTNPHHCLHTRISKRGQQEGLPPEALLGLTY